MYAWPSLDQASTNTDIALTTHIQDMNYKRPNIQLPHQLQPVSSSSVTNITKETDLSTCYTPI